MAAASTLSSPRQEPDLFERFALPLSSSSLLLLVVVAFEVTQIEIALMRERDGWEWGMGWE